MKKLKIALQKSGRLHDESVKLLKECGFNINFGYKLKTETLDFDVLSLRDDDIPKYIQEGIADMGIVGKNVVCEQKKAFLIKEHLGFSLCRLSFAVPKGTMYKTAKDLSGKCIATSYPNLLKIYLNKHNICARIHEISGSVEIAPNIGSADAICDLVSSGNTLEANDLKEIETILFSEAVLICHTKYDQKILAKKLLFRIKSVKKARLNKSIIFFISNNKLDKIISLLHSYKCMNIHIMPYSFYTYIQVIIPNLILWDIIEKLKRNSAKNLLVFPIKNFF